MRAPHWAWCAFAGVACAISFYVGQTSAPRTVVATRQYGSHSAVIDAT